MSSTCLYPFCHHPLLQPQWKGEKGRVSGGLGAAPGILAGPLQERPPGEEQLWLQPNWAVIILLY